MSMRIEKREWRGKQDHFVLLDAGEILGLIKQHGITAGGGWYGDSTEDFRRKAEVGDNGLVAESEKFLASIEDQIPLSRGWVNVDDVVGAIPNVPAFLAGHPQHMRRRQRMARDNSPLTIFMDLTSSAMISARDVTKRGVVLLALTRMLVEHRPVELWVGTAKDIRSGYPKGSGCAAWKIDTAPLDLARSAYHIGAAAMARGFGYGLTDALFRTGGGWPFGDVDLHRQTAAERLKAVFGFSEMLYIPPIHLKDQMTTDPIGWLKKQMKQYVNNGDE
jgi:hypothetical protein